MTKDLRALERNHTRTFVRLDTKRTEQQLHVSVCSVGQRTKPYRLSLLSPPARLNRETLAPPGTQTRSARTHVYIKSSRVNKWVSDFRATVLLAAWWAWDGLELG